MMKIIFLLLCILLFNGALADSSRRRFSFKSNNGIFEFKPSDTLFSDKKVYTDSIYNSQTNTYFISSYTHGDHYFWSLYDTRTNQRLYTIKNDSLFIEFKTALIADNGKSIVIVDDYRAAFAAPDFEVVHFFNKEKLVKVLTLGEILGSMCATSFSVSHMSWCSWFSLEEANTFKIKSYELYYLTYNLNGELVEKISDSKIKPEDHIITARIKRLQKRKYQLVITKSIRGSYHVNDTIQIKCPDRKMKRLMLNSWSIFYNRTRELKKGFYAQLHLRNNMPILNTPLPYYNAPDYCNIDWEANKNGR